jgi:hypothetical protein
MTAIRELCAEHRVLEEHTLMLLRIASNEVADPAAVAMLRWRLARALGDHCAREEREVYDPLLTSRDSSAIAVARHYRREHGQVAASFTRYIAAWPIERIGREWSRFRVETEKVVLGLANRALLEEQILYPHIERVTRRRAA